MAAVGGSIQSVSVKGRLFAVAADADSTRKLGGYANEMLMNGNGSVRIKKTPMGWSVEGLQIEISHDRGDQEFLQDVADLAEPVDISITHADGVTYSGRGLPTGDIVVSSMNATAAVNFGGTGKLEQQ